MATEMDDNGLRPMQICRVGLEPERPGAQRAHTFYEGIGYRKCPSSVQFSSVQSLSHVRLFATPWTTARQASLSIINSWSPPKPMSIESVMPSNHLILCRPLLLLPSIFPSIRVFSNESALRIRWPKCWSFSFNISPSSEHPGDQWRNNSRKNEGMEPKIKQLWTGLVLEARYDAIKNNIA